MRFICLILFLLYVSSCKKEDEGSQMCDGDQTYSPISLTMLDAKYKIGTYWIYLDSVTNIYDSTYVLSTSQSDLYDGCTRTYQIYIYSLRSVPNFEYSSYRIVTSHIFKNSDGPNTGTEIYSQFYNPNANNVYLDSLYVFDRYYKQLSQKTVVKDPTENNYKVIYYINVEFGFVRKDVIDSNGNLISKKLLVRKNIVR